jgi:hypothetical protein
MRSRDVTASSEAEREQLVKRAKMARDFVARVDPSLLEAGVDATLHDLTLARSVIERLEDAYRHELGNVWLRGLSRERPSGGR